MNFDHDVFANSALEFVTDNDASLHSIYLAAFQQMTPLLGGVSQKLIDLMTQVFNNEVNLKTQIGTALGVTDSEDNTRYDIFLRQLVNDKLNHSGVVTDMWLSDLNKLANAAEGGRLSLAGIGDTVAEPGIKNTFEWYVMRALIQSAIQYAAQESIDQVKGTGIVNTSGIINNSVSGVLLADLSADETGDKSDNKLDYDLSGPVAQSNAIFESSLGHYTFTAQQLSLFGQIKAIYADAGGAEAETTLTGHTGIDAVDHVTLLAGFGGDDTLVAGNRQTLFYGGEGTDTADMRNWTAGISLSERDVQVGTGHTPWMDIMRGDIAYGAIHDSVESIITTDYNDQISGNIAKLGLRNIQTGSGNDAINISGTLTAALAIDTGAGDDIINAVPVGTVVETGEGSDRLMVDVPWGEDSAYGWITTVDGGAGVDYLDLTTIQLSDLSVNANLATGVLSVTLLDSQREIHVSHFEVYIGGSGSDFIVASSSSNSAVENAVTSISTGSGNDEIHVSASVTISDLSATDQLFWNNTLLHKAVQGTDGVFRDENGYVYHFESDQHVKIHINGKEIDVFETLGGPRPNQALGATYQVGSIVGISSQIIQKAEYIDATKAKFDLAKTKVSPLIFDLDGDGVETTALNSNGAVYWDVDNDGFREASAWVGKDDALLVRDLNANGKVDNHSELFGTATTDGFSVLTALDSNADNKITSADSAWGTLLAWQDANGDGVSQSSELHTLASLGIGEISLADTALTGVSNNGNTVSHRSTFVINGQTRNIDDVWFNYDNVNSVDARPYTYDPETLLLPELRGYGTVSNLSIAMSKDATLKGLVETVAGADVAALADPHFNVGQKIDEIMYRWAGVDGISPEARGGGLADARMLEFLEELFDSEWRQTAAGNSQSPGGNAIIDLTASYNFVHEAIMGRLLFQSSLRTLFSETPVFNYAADTFTGTYALDEASVADLLTGLPLDDQFYAWANIFKLIDYTVGLDSLTPAQSATITSLMEQFDATGTLDFAFLQSHFEYAFGTVLNGTGGADVISFGIPSGAVINGLGGNDTITGNAGDDVINGGAGADILQGGDGDDTFLLISSTEASGDSIDGGNGHDIVRVNSNGASPINISATTLSNVEELEVNGSGNGDVITINPNQAGAFDKLTHLLGGSTSILIAASVAGTYDFSAVSQITGILNLTGTRGNDTLIGSNFGDVIAGDYSGVDIISGLGGNDVLYASNTGNVAGSYSTIYGGEGNDVIYAGYGADSLYGDNGDDTFVMVGTKMTAADMIDGGAGWDVLASAGGVTLGWTTSLTSMEELRLSGNNSYTYITSYALGQFSTISSANPDLPVSLVATAAGTYDLSGKTIAGTVYFIGSTGYDTIIGSVGNDRINGGNGVDIISTGDGNDTIYVSSGGNCDVVDGGDGFDTMVATGNNADIGLSSLSNIEFISSGGFTGIDIFGSQSNDVLDFSSVTLSGIVSINGGNGSDIITGSMGNDLINGGYWIDTIYAGDGDDVIQNLGSDADIIDGGAGIDTLSVTGNGDDIYVASISNIEVISSGGYTGIDLRGSTGADVLDLSGATLSGIMGIYGGAGNDTITGSSGNDTINGEAGYDNIYAGAGDDLIIAAKDGDYVDGGSGNDIVAVSSANSDIYVSGFTNVEGFSNAGFSGVDIRGTAGADSLDFSSTVLTAIVGIYGGSGGDTIIGNSANNIIYGEAGADIINGGAGNDTLIGGVDADIFAFNGMNNGADVISDFANGVDHIDLRALGINFSALSIATVGTGVKITKSGSTDLDITLNNFSAANVDASDFIFT